MSKTLSRTKHVWVLGGLFIGLVVAVAVLREGPHNRRQVPPANGQSSPQVPAVPNLNEMRVRTGMPLQGPDTPSSNAAATSDTALRERARKVLNDYYFSLEDADFLTFQEAERHTARWEALRELLLAANDPDILAVVFSLAKAEAGKVVSLERLMNELSVMVSSERPFTNWAESSKRLNFFSLEVLEESTPTNVRLFAANLLSVHSLRLAQVPGDQIPQTWGTLTLEMRSKLADVLTLSAIAGEYPLAEALLRVTGPYLADSPEIREAYRKLAASDAGDEQVRGRLIAIITNQKWPVYEDPILFQAVMDSMRPENPRSFLTEAWMGTPLMDGVHPWTGLYFERLHMGYNYYEENGFSGVRDPRGFIVLTVVSLDVIGAPDLVGDYLSNSKAPKQMREMVLERLIAIAGGSTSPNHKYARTRSSVYTMLQRLQLECEKEFQPKIAEAMRAFSD